MFCCIVKIMPTQPYAIAAETIPASPMSANNTPPEKVEFPTVQTSLAETALKAFKKSFVPGLGLLTTLHCEPFQCSISV